MKERSADDGQPALARGTGASPGHAGRRRTAAQADARNDWARPDPVRGHPGRVHHYDAGAVDDLHFAQDVAADSRLPAAMDPYRTALGELPDGAHLPAV